MSQKITQEQVRWVAKLGRLQLDDAQVDHFARQLEAILEYVGKISELDTEHVEPLAHPLDMINALREDQERPGLPMDTALANAPDKAPPFFKVPKVLD